MGRRHRDEQGAVAILLALVICFVMLPLAGLAVDIGVQRVARRDMQALADTVSLDLSRQLNGGAASSYNTATLQTLANASRDRNKGWLGSTPTIAVYLGTVDDTKFSSDQANFCSGSSDGSGYFTKATGAAKPNAVLVTATGSVKFSIHGGDGAVCRSAIAKSTATACFKVGSYAAQVNSSDASLLGPLLGAVDGDLNLSLVSYQGLANAKVSLAALAAQLGAGTPDELVDLDHVSVGNFYAAIAQVLTYNGDTADATLLTKLSTKVGSLPPIDLGSLLNVGQAGAALNTSFDVLTLVSGAALLANGTNALSIPSLSANLLGLSNPTASLSLVQAPQIGCGTPAPTTQLPPSACPKPATYGCASTSQVGLTIGGKLLNVGGLASVPVALSINVANAVGILNNVNCTATPKTIGLAVHSGLIGVSLTLQVVLLGIPISIVVNTNDPGTTVKSATLHAGQDLDTGSGVIGLSNSQVQVNLPTGLGSIVTALLNPLISGVLSGVVSPLLSTVDTALLGPLSDLLGLSIGGAHVFDPADPTCGNPALAN